MLARNPKTGGDIRVISSNASIWKQKKTLYWNSSNENKSPWDSAVFSIKEEFWNSGNNPTMVFLLTDSEEHRKWLKTMDARDTRFIFLIRAIVDTITEPVFQSLRLNNVLCIEELPSMYPFLGGDWDGTPEDAFIMAALVFRYQQVVSPITTSRRVTEFCKLTFQPKQVFPKPFVLIQQYYKPSQKQRANELDTCLEKNLYNPLIEKLYLFVETKDIVLPKHLKTNKKLHLLVKKTRLTYADCIELIQTKIGSGNIVGFANMDIYFNETLEQLWSVDLTDTLLALLRWEDSPTPQLFGPRADSQDSWILDSDSVISKSWNLDSFRIPFGKAGCDNAILVEFLRQKFKIINPALSLQTLHVHTSKVRTYDPRDIVDRPVYMHVEPTGIHELNPILSFKGWAEESVIHEPLERPLKATTPKMLGIFCSQMNRDTSFLWSASGTNVYLPPVGQDHIISIQNGCFVNPNGLVYKHQDLYVGTTDIQKEVWSQNKLSHIMPAQETASMMAFPLEAGWFKNDSLFTLYYLSRVLAQHQKTPEASFWCSQTKRLLSAFQIFRWKEPRGHLLRFSEETQAYSKEVVGRTAHGVRVSRADISALRNSMFLPWLSTPEEKTIVLVSDEKHIMGDLLANLEKTFSELNYTVRTIDSSSLGLDWAKTLRGASHVILSSSVKLLEPSWAWLWIAPKGCKVLELQEEREPSDSLVHLSAAAELDWTLLLYPRATLEGFQKIVLKEVHKWMQVDVAKTDLPVLFVPPKSMKFGFFGHKGDSFRELVELWAERGYIERKEDPILTNCWLHGVGKVLLYDRPSWEWLEKSSDSEKSYQVCLAGNPKGGTPWIFWGRMPRLLEVMAEETNTFQERQETIVFYGRIENDVQGAYRQDISGWKGICSKFEMPVGAKQPYVLSPSEYLTALQNAKYGLCLRGYGPKCNREIELLAMGTVPLVTPDVDIQGYAEPLEDGVHVISVSSPEDAVAKVAAISEEKWTEMSSAAKSWWKRNASVEGSWNVTKKLLAKTKT
jgi:hypothetical protein